MRFMFSFMSSIKITHRKGKIRHEANKLEKDVIIIVISDGQPMAQGVYGLYDAIPDIQHAKKKINTFSL